jgi:hypothetical protein
MKTFGRILGIFFVVVALVILAADLLAAAKSTESRIMPLGQLWYTLDAGSLNLVQAVIERYIWGPLWDPVLAGFLQWPAAPVFGGLGIVILVAPVARLPKRKPKDRRPKPRREKKKFTKPQPVEPRRVEPQRMEPRASTGA